MLMRVIPPSDQLQISEWVERRFETAEPEELAHRPGDLDDYPSRQSDPQSGLTGTVYLADDKVYYYAADTPPKSGRWGVGALPPELQETR